jgi:hypothetical protein
MKSSWLKKILITPLVLFVVFYFTLAILILFNQESVPPIESPPPGNRAIAIFGASGTAGDGILKAALESSDIAQILVITRRTTSRIEEGVASGKVQMTLHTDYLNYSEISEKLESLDAVFWAIGTSSIGVDEKTYGMIHVDFPERFVTQWLSVSDQQDISFHYISSSDISDDSTAMWAREKVRAEKTLFQLAEGTQLRVIAYRPDYIGPTREEAGIGQKILYWFFRPVGAAVKATEIGQAMLEVTARGSEFSNRDRLSTRRIVQYSEAYEQREALTDD